MAPPHDVRTSDWYRSQQKTAPFFFGREAECEIISANLMASRLTLLYGISGVGKSSVLRAGVIPFVRRVADQNRSDPEEPQFAIVEFSSWQDEPTEALIRRVHETLGDESQGRDGELPPPVGFVDRSLGVLDRSDRRRPADRPGPI